MIEQKFEEAFEAMLLNEELRKGTIEQRFAEFGLKMTEAVLVREFQDSRRIRLLLPYLRFRSKAKNYFLKYGDYFLF